MSERANANPVDRILRLGRDLVGMVVPGARRAGRVVRENIKVPAPPTSPPDLSELREKAFEAGTRATRVVTETAATAAGAAATVGQALGDAVGKATSGSRTGATDAVSRAGSATVQGARETAATAASDAGPGSGVAYEEWTKAQLYERAQELDIDGRSSMNKKQLIDALRDQG